MCCSLSVLVGFGVQMAVDAMLAVKTTNSEGEVRYPVKAVSVLKAHGKSARESTLMNGYALNMGRASQGLTKRVDGARIACLDMNLQKQRMHMGIQVAHDHPVLYLLFGSYPGSICIDFRR